MFFLLFICTSAWKKNQNTSWLNNPKVWLENNSIITEEYYFQGKKWINSVHNHNNEYATACATPMYFVWGQS